MIVFSATIPTWIKTNLRKYLSTENCSFVNLIDRNEIQTAQNIQHFMLKIQNGSPIDQMILSLFEKYSPDLNRSQLMIFCQTKKQCDQLIRSNQLNSYPTAVLHSDISQYKREQILHVNLIEFSSSFSFLFLIEFSSRKYSILNHNRSISTRFRYSTSRFSSPHIST